MDHVHHGYAMGRLMGQPFEMETMSMARINALEEQQPNHSTMSDGNQ
jgi:hypothetical protein